MTIQEAKTSFGRKHDGYISCFLCPLEDGKCPFAFSGTGYQDCWDAIANATTENPYWERICKLSERQRAKGMETYGQGLESNPADMLKRIEHLQEELIDGLMYCEWIKEKLMEKEGEKYEDLLEQN